MPLPCSALASLSNELSHVRLGVSPAVATPAIVYSLLWVFRFLFHQSCLAHAVYHLAMSPLSQPYLPFVVCHLALCILSLSFPPSSFGECFFFNSLVVSVPCSLIFRQFWFIVFRLVVILLLLVWGSEAFLSTPPSWLELISSNILSAPFHLSFHFETPVILVWLVTSHRFWRLCFFFFILSVSQNG